MLICVGGGALLLTACGKKNTPVTPSEPTVERHYITVGWYDRTSTSGLTTAIMEQFQTALLAHLEAQGATAEELEDVKIVPVGEGGQVAALAAAVIAQGNIDILLGSGKNIVGSEEAGDLLKNYIVKSEDPEYVTDDATNGYKLITDLTMGTKTGRVISQLYESTVVDEVFEWLKTTEAQNALLPPVEPITNYDITIAWWAYTTTTGLEAGESAIKTAFITQLKNYLKTQGATDEQLTAEHLVIRDYTEADAATLAQNVMAEEEGVRPDIIVSIGNNISGAGAFGSNVTARTAQADFVPMGSAAARGICRLNEDALTILVYNWIDTNMHSGTNSVFYVEPEEPDIPTSISNYQIVIGWWTNSKSGLTEDSIATVTTQLRAYLASEYGATSEEQQQVVFRAYNDSNMAGITSSVTTDGDVGMFMGTGSTLGDAGNLDTFEASQSGLTMGEKTGRYIFRYDATDVAQVVFAWLVANITTLTAPAA